jgi:polar amino acid transport system substrate-binding protein
MNKVFVFLAITTLATAFTFTSCQTQEPARSANGEAAAGANLTGKRIAVKSGTLFADIVNQYMPGSSLVYFDTSADCAKAVMSGKADAMLDDRPINEKLVELNPELRMLLPPVAEDSYGVMTPKGSPLIAKLNRFHKDAVASGLYAEIINRWFQTGGNPKMPDISQTGAKGTLNVITDGKTNPFSYYDANNELTGFSVEYMNRFASEYGYKIKWTVADPAGVLAAMRSGDADAGASSFSITEERKKDIDFTDPYYVGGFTLVTKK